MRLWAALPAGTRGVARRNGFPLSALNGPALIAARALIADQVFNGFVGEAWIPHLISTAVSMSEGSVLFIEPTTPSRGIGVNADVKYYRPGQTYSVFQRGFEGWFFQMGTPPKFLLTAMVPLYPGTPR